MTHPSLPTPLEPTPLEPMPREPMSVEATPAPVGASPTPTPPPSSGTSVRRLVGANVGAKVVVLGLSGLFSVLTARLMIGHFGVAAYAQFGLLATMATLLPFADLGAGAAVSNRIAESGNPRSDPAVRGTLVAALRLTLLGAGVLALAGLVVTALGAWPTLLGGGLLPGAGTAALLCVLTVAVAVPLGLGQRILNALGRNHVYVLLSGVAAPFLFLCVAGLVLFDIPAGSYLAVCAYRGAVVVGTGSMVVAGRAVAPQLRAAWRDVPQLRTARSEPVGGLAWPMLIQSLALPVAMQSDRLLLSHLADVHELAQYNLGAQLFGLVLQAVSAAGLALWPVFARARASRELRSPFRMAAGFGLGALVACALVGVATPILVPLITGGRLALDIWVVTGFAVFVCAQATKYPLGMYMTDARGLRFQVAPILVLVPGNLALSWYLIGPLGAGGPVVGSAIAVVLCQVLPSVWYVRRDLARRAAPAGPAY